MELEVKKEKTEQMLACGRCYGAPLVPCPVAVATTRLFGSFLACHWSIIFPGFGM